jgi:TolB-like protein
MLDLRLFGHMEVRGPDGPIDLANAKLSGLLAYLALAGKRPVPREQLTELLWGSHFEEQARQNFRQALSRLRKLLGGDVFASEDQFIQLDPAIIRSDVAQFEALLRDNSHQGLRDATRLVDGDLLEGIAIKEPGFTEWIAGERRRIAKLVLEALLKLGEAELAEGSLDAAHASAEAAMARDEYNEAAHRLLMRAEAAAGRKSDALRHFQSFSARLSKYLGAAPEAETLTLVASLRDGVSASAAPAMEPGRPSIAVMPFANLSNDPEQEYFADGMVDDIIVALSRFSWLTVIARNSTLGYKGRAVDARQVSQELGVRYILEGSVRKSGDQLRISGQLIDAKTDGTIWADRFDGRLQNVFELQDQVASKAVSAITPKLEQVEIERARKKPTENLDAYDHYLRGVAELNRWTL